MINQQELTKLLIDQQLIDDSQLAEAVAEASDTGKPLEQVVIGKKFVSTDSLYQAVATHFKLPFIDLKNRNIRKDVLFVIPEVTAQTHKTIAFDQTDHELLVATLDPSNLELLDFLGKKTGLEIKAHITTPENLQEGLKKYHVGLSAELKGIETAGQEAAAATGDEDLKTIAQDIPIVRIVDTLLEYSILEKASDIHIEPTEKEVNIRYRVDGILRKVMTLPKATHAGVTARIKILSNLKLDEHRLPQDGRFKVKSADMQVSFRVSIIPTFDGEKIVMRLLPDQAQQLTLEQLGFQPRSFELVKQNIGKPHGMILVTGPTGSGKTTTLYSILGVLNRPEVNISTIEDPIEYRIAGINQCQVQPKIGFTFAAGLRAFLRQDPNIIMVGEIRDGETADIAINAAMTGHLVLSTLHTNDAVTTIPRLTDMNIPTFLIASTVNVIIAQRLVRKICKHCIESYNLDKSALKELEQRFDLKQLAEHLTGQGLLIKGYDIKSILFYRGKGCAQCGDSGYKGRMGIYETLEVTEEISKLILAKASREEIERVAIDQGMTTIAQDGFIKAKQGVTTIEEVLRVTQE